MEKPLKQHVDHHSNNNDAITTTTPSYDYHHNNNTVLACRDGTICFPEADKIFPLISANTSTDIDTTFCKNDSTNAGGKQIQLFIQACLKKNALTNKRPC